MHKIFVWIQYIPYNLIEDYFMQMLNAIALQMVHPLSPILAYSSFQHFGRYLTNKCFNVICQCANCSGLVCIDMSFNISPQGVNSHDLGGQMTGSEREIKCSPNLPLNKSFVTRAVRHVAPSCWNHMLLYFGQKKVEYHLTLALTIHSYVTIRSMFEENGAMMAPAHKPHQTVTFWMHW